MQKHAVSVISFSSNWKGAMLCEGALTLKAPLACEEGRETKSCGFSSESLKVMRFGEKQNGIIKIYPFLYLAAFLTISHRTRKYPYIFLPFHHSGGLKMLHIRFA